MKKSIKATTLFQNKKDKKYDQLCYALFVMGMTTGCTSLINLLLNY